MGIESRHLHLASKPSCPENTIANSTRKTSIATKQAEMNEKYIFFPIVCLVSNYWKRPFWDVFHLKNNPPKLNAKCFSSDCSLKRSCVSILDKFIKMGPFITEQLIIFGLVAPRMIVPSFGPSVRNSESDSCLPWVIVDLAELTNSPKKPIKWIKSQHLSL